MLSLLVTTDEYTMCNEAAKLRKNTEFYKFFFKIKRKTCVCRDFLLLITDTLIFGRIG